ncbi:MAG: hypothetical protein ABIK89_11300 [Planctomycetota bacterium]
MAKIMHCTDACIIAESSAPPHENGICICSPGVSAIDKAYKIYRALYEFEQEWGLKRDKSGLTPHGFPTIPIGWVKGHPRGIELPYLVADHCKGGRDV